MSIQQTNLAHSQSSGILTMQTDFAALKARIAQMQQFVREYMTPGEDFGVIEGTGKPTLLKPGAEKLCDVYGLSAGEAQIEFVRDDTKTPTYIAYRLSLPLMSRMDGRVIMVGVGSCNSWEKKYRWRWAFDNELPQGMLTDGLQTKTGTKRNGDKWTKYRVPNDEIDDVDNTLLKMAKKRALIDAVLSATRSSALFTQDIEDEDMAVRSPDTTERDEKRQSSGTQRQSAARRQNSSPAPEPTPTDRASDQTSEKDEQRKLIMEQKLKLVHEVAEVQLRLGLEGEIVRAECEAKFGIADPRKLSLSQLSELRDHFLQMERDHNGSSDVITDEEMEEMPF